MSSQLDIDVARTRDIIKYPHQYKGVNWCLTREHEGFYIGDKVIYGGILADEMGLGKTYQMMALIVSNFVSRTLIVLPKSLIQQWNDVIQNTLGHSPIIFHGNGLNVSLDKLKNAPIVLTTYGMLTETKRGFRLIHTPLWERVIFDEAHHLRNHNTKIHKGAIMLKSRFRWLVTGTPIHNRKQDYFSLCRILGIDKSYLKKQDNLNVFTETCVLKRTIKSVGIQLPKLNRHNISVPWTNPHEHNLAKQFHSSLPFLDYHNTHNTNTKTHADIKTSLINTNLIQNNLTLTLLIRARQSCIYPALINLKSIINTDMITNEYAFRDALSSSSKIDKVVETILSRKNNRKKIIFCHFHAEIDILKKRLIANQFVVNILDGRTDKKLHTKNLYSNTDVLIMHYQTGCEGLNLQLFTEIYFVSPHWNPAVEDQAIARAWRIGQTSTVDVFTFQMESFNVSENQKTCIIDKYIHYVHCKKRNFMSFLNEIIEDDESLDITCSICFNNITKHTSTTLPCNHTFHKKCIRLWSTHNKTCPYCRAMMII